MKSKPRRRGSCCWRLTERRGLRVGRVLGAACQTGSAGGRSMEVNVEILSPSKEPPGPRWHRTDVPNAR